MSLATDECIGLREQHRVDVFDVGWIPDFDLPTFKGQNDSVFESFPFNDSAEVDCFVVASFHKFLVCHFLKELLIS